jgi:diguanylate cyclase (GGDEF)-like protein
MSSNDGIFSFRRAGMKNSDESPDIRSELICIVYKSVPLSLLAILVNSLVLSIVQWNVVSQTAIISWFCITNGLSVLRFIIYQRFNKLEPDQDISDFWFYLTLLTSLASGFTWGAVAVWLFPADDIAHQVFAAFVLAGMCAGAVTTLSPLLSLVSAFILATMMPVVISFLMMETGINYAMATMAILFTIMLLSTSVRFNQTIRESLFIRHARRIAEEKIQYQAQYDPLTNLPNRRLLTDRLKQEIARSIRHNHIGAVLFLDLDHFKTINDSLGHTIGDELLRQVAQRIGTRVRDEDTAARLGGDEFIILISEVSDDPDEAMDSILNLAEEFLSLFAEPFDINGHDIHLTVSIGIALFPLTEADPDQLLQKSDVAMYEAKKAGRNRIRLFIPEMQQTVDNRRAVEKGLHQALSEKQLELYYQSQVDATGKIIGLEALLRWNHPEKGIIAPAEFVEIAEKCGLIVNIGDWVLRTACMHLSQLSVNQDITMCINVSPRQFAEPSFVDKVITTVADTGVNPHDVQLEITEGMVLRDIEASIDKMQQLKAAGVTLSVDDFGTGYSSLAYLKRLPVDVLKIDKSFIREIDNANYDGVIVETIIAMAQHMKLDIVAEGVETQRALNFLKSRGCQKFQGYLFGEPMPFGKMPGLIGEVPEYKKAGGE